MMRRDRRARRRARCSILACSLLAYAGAAAADDASAGLAAMQEGTRLAQRGLNRAAMRFYEDAIAAGVVEPLLYYNMGVAQYRIGEFEAAEDAFAQASADPNLAGLALYNLGLAQRAAGNLPEARRSFAAAAAASEGALRGLAERASADIAPTRVEPEPRLGSRSSRPVGELSVSLVSGFGFDDNIYRTPPAPYADLSKPGAPEVTPVIVGSSFVPLDLTVQYRLHTKSEESAFLFTYDVDGRYYESEFANADDVSQELSLALEVTQEGRNARSRMFRPALFAADYYRGNYDPDDGFDREIDEEGLEERIAYRGGGIRVDYEHRFRFFTWSVRAQLERRFHKPVPIVADYDQELAVLHTALRYSLTDQMGVKVGFRRYRRTFEERAARDLSGALSGSPLSYDYDGIDIGFERRFGTAFLVEIEGLHLRRVDGFEGYGDYDQERVSIAGTYLAGSRVELSAAVISGTYDFPNAFAFNIVDGGVRQTEYVGGELQASYRFNDRLSLLGEVVVFEVASTDYRAEHSRTRSGLGVRWRL